MERDTWDARMLGLHIRIRERDRDAYAAAVARWIETRSYPAETSGYWRGAKMSATYQLKREERRVDKLLACEEVHP